MNHDTFQSTDQHQQILLLLPWYLNHSLEVAELELVENHLHGCIQCNQELLELQKLAVAVKQSVDMDMAAEASFDKLREKLQTALPNRQNPKLSVVPRAGGRDEGKPGLSGNGVNRHKSFLTYLGPQGTRLAIAASLLLAITPLILHYENSTTTTGYFTLSDAKPETSLGPQLRVVFSKSLSDSDIDALLTKVHGQRIDGPNSVGAYTVRLDSDKNAQEVAVAIAFLRSERDVLLAEPVAN